MIVSEKVTGMPTVGDAGDGAPIVIEDAALTLIVTVAVGAVVAVPPVPPVPPDDDTPVVAVTLAVLFVVSCVVAVPVASVVAMVVENDPLSVEKVTGTPGGGSRSCRAPARRSSTCRRSTSTVLGLALRPTLAAAAAPIAILTAFVPLADTPPEIAVIVAVPEAVPATYFTVTRPLTSVSASDG